MRGQLKEEHYATRARLHIPQLTELMDKCEMGWRARRRQFPCGSPIIGDSAEPGERPTCVDAEKPMVREELFGNELSRVKFGRKESEKEAAKL